MLIEVLPGFSPKNEEWASSVQKKLSSLEPVTVVRWSHWDSGKTEAGWIEKEADKIVRVIGANQIKIIAKSVGTLVAMEVLRSKPTGVRKLVLCGIPVEDFQEGDNERFEVLKSFDPEKVIIFQNAEDPHGKTEQVRTLMDKVDLPIKIYSKPRNDHEYPYTGDFIEFLSENGTLG